MGGTGWCRVTAEVVVVVVATVGVVSSGKPIDEGRCKRAKTKIKLVHRTRVFHIYFRAVVDSTLSV